MLDKILSLNPYRNSSKCLFIFDYDVRRLLRQPGLDKLFSHDQHGPETLLNMLRVYQKLKAINGLEGASLG